jgi:hypothetical protein
MRQKARKIDAKHFCNPRGLSLSPFARQPSNRRTVIYRRSPFPANVGSIPYRRCFTSCPIREDSMMIMPRSSAHLLTFAFASLLLLAPPARADAPPASNAAGGSFVRPELPRQFVDTAMPQQRGKTTAVSAGGDLQAALDAAKPGDTLVLDAGATYGGSFVLPKKDGEGWVVITSSAEKQLPPPGTRVHPDTHAALMPKIVTGTAQPALRAKVGAHHYRFIGIEFSAAPEVKRVSAIVELSHQSKVLDDVPSHFVFDRVYIHGNPTLDSQRGLAMNSRHTAVIDSWIDECHIHGADSQAICGWNGPGPFKIVNNFLEAGAENIMFGGAKNTAQTMVAADIEIRRNHLYKNPAWFTLKYPDNWVIKNVFEIKTARRVLFEANVLENCWAEGQTGFAFVLKSSSADQGQPWDTTSDLTIRNNRIINSLNGVSIARWSSSGPVAEGAEPTSRILFEHNLFERFGAESDYAKKATAGILFQIAGRDLAFVHNTAWANYGTLSLTGPIDNLIFLDNLVTPGSYFLHADGGKGAGWKGALASHIHGDASRMEGNTIIREGSDRARKTSADPFPPNNKWFDSFEAAGVDPKTYRLSPTSPAKGTAADKTDPGADVDAVMKATEGVRSEPRKGE